MQELKGDKAFNALSPSTFLSYDLYLSWKTKKHSMVSKSAEMQNFWHNKYLKQGTLLN